LKEADLRNTFEKASMSLCLNRYGISCPLSLPPSTSSTMKTPKNIGKEPDELKQADEYSSG
jgi:hypothetical protein